MIESRIIKYLSDNVVFTSVNEPSPEKQKELGGKWINLSKTSEYQRNLVDYATFKLFVYAPTIRECSELSKQIKDALYNIVLLENIQSCEINDIREDIDTMKKRNRYSIEFDLCFFE